MTARADEPREHRYSALFITDHSLIAAAVMRTWLAQGHGVAALWIGPISERKFLRQRRWIRRLAPSWSVAALTQRHRIPIRSQTRLSTWPAAADEAARTGADVLITCMTFQIVPPAMLDLFGDRAFNFHPALLPSYRGPAPRSGMILDGRTHDCSGVTLHRLSPGIDEGDIVGQRAVPFAPGHTFNRWSLDLAQAAAGLTAGELQSCLGGQLQPKPQDARIAFYRRIAPGELVIDETTTAERAKWLTTAFRRTGHVRLQVGDRTLATGRVRRTGPRSNGSAVITADRVEMELLDARLVFERKTRKTRRRDEIRLLGQIAAHAMRLRMTRSAAASAASPKELE